MSEEKKGPAYLEASYDSDLYYLYVDTDRLRTELQSEADKNGVDVDDYEFDSVTISTRAYRRSAS